MNDEPELTKRLPAVLRALGYQIKTVRGWSGLPMIGPKNWNAPPTIHRYVLVDPNGRSVASDRRLKNVLSDAKELKGA